MNYTSLTQFKRDLPLRWRKQVTVEYNLAFPPSFKNTTKFGLIKQTRKIAREQRVWLYDFTKSLLSLKISVTQDESLCNIICNLEDDLGVNWEGL